MTDYTNKLNCRPQTIDQAIQTFSNTLDKYRSSINLTNAASKLRFKCNAQKQFILSNKSKLNLSYNDQTSIKHSESNQISANYNYLTTNKLTLAEL